MGILSSSLSAAWLRLVALVAAVALGAVGLVVAAPYAKADGLPPTLTTDLPDYNPGATVTLGGAHWAPSLPIHVRVDDNVGAGWYLDSDPDPVASSDGTLDYQFRLPFDVIALYTAVATQTQQDGTVLTASVTFTDAAGGNLDQCANGKLPAAPVDCTGAQWQNGNLNEQNSQWVEGDSVPFRLVLTGLPGGTTPSIHTVTIGWDLTEGGNWAYDYLTDYDRTTGSTADPCSGVTGCDKTNKSTQAFTADPLVAAAAALPGAVNPSFQQIAGSMTAFSKAGKSTTISGMSYTYDPKKSEPTTSSLSGTVERRLEFSISTNSETVVLAWGGHIATRKDWGTKTAVADINGSPYHMRFIDLNGAGGNQDRSLKASAVIFPAKITIIKQTNPDGASQSFGFTATSPMQSPFNLSDGQSTTYDTKVFQPYTVTEGTAAGWSLTGIVCTSDFSNGGSQTVSVPSRNVVIDLKEGEYITCTFTNQANPKALTVSKTFTPTYTRTYSYDITKDVDKTSVSIADGGEATFNYTVKASSSYVDSAFGGNGKITVTNPNAGDVTGVTVADTTDNGLSCSVVNGSNVTVPGNGSVTLDYTCTAVATKPAAGTNTATATWATQTVNGVSLPGGSANGTAAMAWSGSPTTIENQSVTVKDDQATPGDTSDDITLGTMSYTDSSPQTYTYSLKFKGVGGTCTDYTNTASLSNGKTASQKVTVCVGKDLSVSKTVTPTFGRTYTWDIAKSVDKTEFLTSAGGKVTAKYTVTLTNTSQDGAFQLKGTITVTNPNDWQAVVVDISDAADAGTALCTIDGGGTGITVPKRVGSVDGSTTVNYTCSLSSATDLTTGTNTATATWNKDTYKTPTGSASGSAPYSFVGVSPSITNGTINVTDDKTTGTPVSLGSFSYTGGATQYATYSIEFTAPDGTCKTYDNTATIVENKDTAKASVKVCGAVAPKASKKGSGAYSSAYTWTIDKTADTPTQTVPEGTKPNLGFKVTVTQTGYSESGISASGTIDVTNGNDWQAITVDITDAMPGGSCSVTDGTGVVVPAKVGGVDGKATRAWSCSFASLPAGGVAKNTATITWDQAAAHTATGSATASADITFTVGTQSDRTVTITDSFEGGALTTLGTLTGTTSEPFTTDTFTYTVQVEPKAGTCTTYTNWAYLSTGAKDDATAEVCVAKDLSVTKTGSGTYDEAFFWDITKKASPASQTVPAGTDATIDYEVVASQTGYSQSGGQASGVITITNPNDFQAITVDLTDSLPGATCAFTQGGVGITGSAIPVDASGTVKVDYSCSYATVPASKKVTNTAKITWDKAAASTPNGSAEGTAEFELALDQSQDKTVTVKDVFNGGSAETNGTLTGVPTLDGSKWTTQTWDYPRMVTAPAGSCAQYDNTASISGDAGSLLGSAKASATVCGALDLTIDKTATGTYDRAATWDITKSASPTDSVVPAGQGQDVDYTVTVTQKSYSETNAKVSGTITITNPNKFGGTLDVTVTDSLGLANTTCVITEDGTALVGGKATIGQNASKTFDYTCTYDLFVPADKDQTNTATVGWDKAQMNSANSSATVDKKFTLTVGKSTDIDITVTDTFDGVTTSLGSLSAATAAPYTTKDYTYSHTITPPAGSCVIKDNTATIVETKQEASASAKVCGAVAPTATKKGAGTYNSTYGWEIDKVAGAKQTLPEGTTPIKVSYTVTVKQTAYSESGASASGTITVSNGNDFQALDVAVSDSMGVGSTCLVEGVASKSVSVPASSDTTLAWSCSFDPAPTSRTIENVATITWDKDKAHTTSGQTTAKADIIFSLGTETDAIVTVTDTFNGGAPVELDKVTGAASSDPADWVSKEYPLSYEVTPKAGTCTKYPNEAAITGIDKADATAEVCVAKDLTVSKTAKGSYDEAYTWDITKKASPSSQTVPAGTSAKIDYEVVASQTGYSQSGGEASGVITITNPNDFQAVTVDLTDSLPGATCTFTRSGAAIDGTAIVVAAGGSVKVDYSCTYATVPEAKEVTNTATITWDQEAASTPSGTAEGKAEFTLALDKSKDKVVSIDDAFNGQAEEPVGELTGNPTADKAFWASDSWKYSRTVTAPDGTCAQYDNTASISGDGDTLLDSAKASATVCGALDLTIDKTAEGTYDRAATWDITKSASPTDSVVPAGQGQDVDYTVTVTQKSYSETNAKVSGTITITNPNKFGGTLDVTVTDSLGLANTTCVISEDGTALVGGKATIGEDSSKTFDYTCTYDLFVPTDKNQKNTATVGWDKAQMNSANSSASVEKEFTLTVGTSTNMDITVTDTYDGTTTELGKLSAATAAPYTTKDYTYSHTITPDAGTCLTKDNTAKIVETKQQASASAKVCAAADLTVSKTATPTFTRTYNWTISKSVDKTTVQIPAGSATFNYTVVAEQTGYTDSLWKVTGTITVKNPNTFQAVTTDITDSILGATCVVSGGTAVTVPAGGSVDRGYVCTFSTSQTGEKVVNKATATWDQATYGTPNGSASGTASATFSSPTTSVNKTITVKDTWDGATTTLGTLTATDATPYTKGTFTYSKSVNAPAAGTCVTKNNTAVIAETGQSASQSVKVCGPDPLGSRTIGFWQNKNGQGIIKAGSSTAGVCKSGNWLRQYNPYKDLSSTADCAAVATYVYNVIKAATAKGAAMNPMLKAQMLATALDVYFSDPALGGNKIGAPQPIGPRVIDLTQICKYLGGTTCSGSLYDVSSVFGGSPKSVLEMLAYASSQSNSGGSIWYGQVKSTQEKAKDAFDAINNDQVLVVGP